MTLPSESVTLAGSGLVFVNGYGAGVDAVFRSEAIAAENFFQSQFTNPVTINVTFDLRALGPSFTAHNEFDVTRVSYAQFTAALQAHATTADDQLAMASLPADPSQGLGFTLPTPYAIMLGLAPQTNLGALSVELNNDGPLTFADAVGALEHELSEGGFGRLAGLGLQGGWQPLDLFRFTAAGARDFTGGADGLQAFFGIDSGHVTPLAFHNAVNAAGVNDGFDLGDWVSTPGEAFGAIAPGRVGTVSATDLRVLDVLGWAPTSGGAYIPAPDDFASSLTDVSRPFGQVAVGGSATGALQTAGDRDWFAVQLQAGVSYTVSLTGHQGGGGTLADPQLRLHDASGAVVATNDDVISGTNPDSRVVFVAPANGAFYAEAGASLDGYAGSYTLSVSSASTGGAGEVLAGTVGDNTVTGGAGDDTITAALGTGPSYLRGGPGDDMITGGAGFNDMNGNQGADTIHGGGGDNWVVGGQGADMLFGGGGTNLILGNLGNDTLHAGPGADVLRGGQGDDVLFGGPGADYISGDRGNDTESGGPGADLFHTFSGAGIDVVLDFNLAEGDRVMLDPGTAFTVSQVGADTVIDMHNGDQMTLAGVQMTTLTPGWIFGA